ncbi:hypothetical protein F3Y22_tig00017404pilonHSYRG00004 [Hibiscus syriacus]|uniref:Pectinesterase inhibitor domain-containing protein n=1 Tax=Hibiscus syriacus TaxID=106335 RepID=A0A6A3BWB2_HIBSY|nr:hypothetical protein F3Y22_tig00017404pilonHSYRG00004 [Hibiscus syriacus]
MRMKDVHLLHSFLERSAAHMQSAINLAHSFNDGISSHRGQASLDDCLELMELSRDRIMDSIVDVERRDVNWHTNGQSWLSSVLTNHVTCWDGLQGSVKSLMEPVLGDLISRPRTSLAILALPNEVKANVVVAKDGSGNYKTLGEAVAAAPDKSETRYIIYVKKAKAVFAFYNAAAVGDGFMAQDTRSMLTKTHFMPTRTANSTEIPTSRARWTSYLVMQLCCSRTANSWPENP